VRHVIDAYARPYLVPASRVLEIGPGGGRYTALLLEHCASLLGVDVSARMVERLRRRFAAEPRATFVQGSGHDLVLVPDRSIDFACACNVFVQLEVEDVWGYLVELARVLRPGGHAALHYADLSNPEGFEYFTAQRTKWIRDFGKRGRFCELTLATMALLAERAGLTVVRNQYVGRDSMVVVRAGGLAAGTIAAPAATRRDFTRIERTLDVLAADVYQEAPTPHHTAAAHATALELLADLPIGSAIELGCGSAPTLDWLAARGVATVGVSLGAEPCRHAVVAADMQFSGLPSGSADLVIARHALEHSPMPLLLLFEMARLSRRWALVVVPCDEQIWIDWPNHYSVFGKPMWRRLFARAGFRIVRELDGPLEPRSTEWCFLLEQDG
jgi:SAM-dependent methyltransferase